MEGSMMKAQKIQAMKKQKRALFVYNFVLYSLTSIITCLFFSYSFWFSSMMHLLLALSNEIPIYFNGKCFFVVGNLIVIILIREMKATRSSYSSPASNIYDEYLARSQSYREKSPPTSTYVASLPRSQSSHDVASSNIHADEKKEEQQFMEEKKPRNIKYVYGDEKKKEMRLSRSMHKKQKKVGMRKCKSEVWGESGRETNEEKLPLSTDDLNKRVEAFIARVNKQRLLEI